MLGLQAIFGFHPVQGGTFARQLGSGKDHAEIDAGYIGGGRSQEVRKRQAVWKSLAYGSSAGGRHLFLLGFRSFGVGSVPRHWLSWATCANLGRYGS